MILVDDALAIIKQEVKPLKTEIVHITQALNRVLAEEIVAQVNNPPLNVSAMDGYAVRYGPQREKQISFKLIGVAAAGAPFEGILEPNTAIRIYTGAAVPEHADAVEIQENVELIANNVFIRVKSLGNHIRIMGSDFSDGDCLLVAPTYLNVRHIGLLAAANRSWVRVYKQPRVAIISTGDEIALPGEKLGQHQMASSNASALDAFVRKAGCLPTNLGTAKDNKEDLIRIAEEAKDFDVIVSTGGVSVGNKDLVSESFSEAGLLVKFHKVAIKPGKPVLFGLFDKTPMLGLPGNPISALVCSLVFLKPCLDQRKGLMKNVEPIENAITLLDLPANGNRKSYLRSMLTYNKSTETLVEVLKDQSSNRIAAFAKADALIIRDPNVKMAKAGSIVPIIKLNNLI